jgi:hypothetical protein
VARRHFEHEAEPASENLLALDGYVFFIDEAGEYRVKFEVQKVDVSAERPHGIKYSITLHNSANRRLVGFDNAHPAKTRSVGGAGEARWTIGTGSGQSNRIGTAVLPNCSMTSGRWSIKF